MHDVDSLVGEYVPVVQLVHCDERLIELVPAGHDEHSTTSASEEYLPSGQMWHAVAPSLSSVVVLV